MNKYYERKEKIRQEAINWQLKCYSNNYSYLELAYCHEKFTEYFEETTLTEREIWQLLENMKELYILRQYSDFLHIGGANVTECKNKELIKNEDEYKRINTLVIPTILDKVYEMLGEEN